MLYYDEAGELQGRSAHTSAVSRIRLAEGCTCEASSQISGPLQWSSGGGSATVRASLEVTVDSFGSGDLEVIAGAELSEQENRTQTGPLSSSAPHWPGRACGTWPSPAVPRWKPSAAQTTYPRRARLRKASC
ncbi:MAG: hypothetical protein ACLSHU_06045 [Oscillospiraceae bacterium]